ncbi:hypothetical protein BT69DRAFT_1260891 [Atractiella rhizophila]|nr:hypothetical protein BT69DRAFT_1260891 [Atractiella rhizophila]
MRPPELTLWVSEGTPSADILINAKALPFSIGEGDVLKIGGKLIFKYEGESEDAAGSLQLQVSANVARTFGWRHRDVVKVEKIPAPLPPSTQITHIELLFGSQYLGRADQFQLSLVLLGRSVFQNQIVSLPSTNIRCRIDRIHSDTHSTNVESRDKASLSGIVNSQTQFVFRSESCKQYIMIQVSKEMFEFDDDGTMYFERCVHVFLPSLFQKWEARRTSHSVSLVMFGRVRYDQAELGQVREPVTRDEDGQGGYKDFYKVVVDLDSHLDEDTILLKVMKEFVDFRRIAMSEMASKFEGDIRLVGRLTYAFESSFLEPINLVFNAFDKHYIDRDLSKTGLSIVFVTAGTCFFKVDKRLLRLTIERAMYLGLGVDLVSLSKKPLHAVPLLLFMSSNPQEFRHQTSDRLSPTSSHRKLHPSSPELSTKNIWDEGDSADPLYFDHPAGPSAEILSFYVKPIWVDCSFFAKQYDKPFRIDRFIPRARVGEISMMGVTQLQPILLPFLDLKIPLDEEQHHGFLPARLLEMSERSIMSSSNDEEDDDSPWEEKNGSLQIYSDVGDQWFRSSNAQKRQMLRDAYDAQVFAPRYKGRNPDAGVQFAGSSYSTGDENPYQFNSSPYGHFSNGDESSGSFDGPTHAMRPKLKAPEQIVPPARVEPKGEAVSRGRSTDVVSTLSQAPERSKEKDSEKGRSPTPVARLKAEDAAISNPTSPSLSAASRSTSVASNRSFTSTTTTGRTTTTIKDSSQATTTSKPPLLISRFMAPSKGVTTLSKPRVTSESSSGPKFNFATKAKATTTVTMSDELIRQLEPEDEDPRVSQLQVSKKHGSRASGIDLMHARAEPPEPPRPFNPSKSSKTPEGPRARDKRRWQNVFPKSFIDQRSIKWRSLATPASLPLVSDYIPSQEEQRYFYVSEKYEVSMRSSSLMLKARAIKKSRPWALVMEMMCQRLAQGFQIITKAYRYRRRGAPEFAESDKYKTISDILDDLERGRTTSVYLSLSNQIHKISYSTDSRFVTVDILTRKRTWATEDYVYNFAISSTETFRDSRIRFAYPSLISPEDWEYLDTILSGGEKHPSLRDSMKYWRMRCVLLPKKPTEESRAALIEQRTQLDASATDEDIRLTGMFQLFSLFEDARWCAPGMNLDDDPISVEFTTLEPPIYALSEARHHDNRQYPANARRLQGTPLDTLAKLMCDPVSGVELRNRNWWGRKHQDVFVGFQFVTWLVNTFEDVPTREKAIELGDQLRRQGLFEHATKGSRVLLDGWFFYNIKGDYREFLPRNTGRWFGNTQKADVERQSNAIPSRDSSPTAQNRTSPMRTENRGQIVMSRVIILDLDKFQASERSEILWLHLDISHNPLAAFHLELSWLRLTASLLTPTLDMWQRTADQYGLNLVETNVGQLEGDDNPFELPTRISFAIPPPAVTNLEKLLQPSVQSFQYFERQLLKNLDYLLDIEMDAVFSPTIDVKYTYRRDPCHHAQFLHRSGCASVAVLNDGEGFLFLKNRLFISRSRARHASIPDVDEICRELETVCKDETKLQKAWDDIFSAMSTSA